jgi:hypothetical protein
MFIYKDNRYLLKNLYAKIIFKIRGYYMILNQRGILELLIWRQNKSPGLVFASKKRLVWFRAFIKLLIGQLTFWNIWRR